ncbi:MAG TPA: MMPL family transporter, partial [Stellaceae bacterium]|nr:MMPL family transporter [Stellaceae bacterium]
LADSPAAAATLAVEIERLPEVSHTLTVMTFVPSEQIEKLAIIHDVAMLLGPTLSPARVKPVPDAGTEIEAIQEAASVMARAAEATGRPSVRRMAVVLQLAVAQGSAVLPLLRANLIAGLDRRLAEMRLALTAGPVGLETLPTELSRDWVAPDGRARIQVYPSGNASGNKALRRFVSAVRTVVPDATGAPVSIQESARTISGAFRDAGILALIAIAALLALVLRRIRDVLLVLAPLLLAGLLTVATSVIAGLPLNFANIIALPLLLGVGVAFDIYFVMNWRAGVGEPLQSGTARAVLFSALTTAAAFGSLALSKHPGTSQMGVLLTIALGYTLFCTFFVLPALLGPVKPREGK